MAVRFTTTLVQAEGKKATGIAVPAEVMAELGPEKRPKVVVTLNGYSYRTTIAPSGDVFMLPVSAAHRDAAAIAAGDEVEVSLALDLEPRTVEVPDDLMAALTAAGVQDAFVRAAFSTRKEWVRQVEEAKAAATRERRIEAIVSKLTQ